MVMPEPDEQHRIDELDDLDRLFLTRLERASVPDDLMARVLASTVVRAEVARSVFAWPWIVAGLVALGVLVVAGYQLGVTLAMSGAVELFVVMFDDLGLVLTAPGDVAAAVTELIPWGLVGVAGLCAGLLILAAGNVVSVSRAPVRVSSQRMA
jgi:hypothetical protein